MYGLDDFWEDMYGKKRKKGYQSLPKGIYIHREPANVLDQIWTVFPGIRGSFGNGKCLQELEDQKLKRERIVKVQ